jgi:uncharacterized PurR-regulated membrane protein YhhQ (DUF165 family)
LECSFKNLPEIDQAQLHERRERVFLIFAGLFLGTLTMLNILGISRFIVFASWSDAGGWQWGQWGAPGSIPFAVAVGVLPYPVTFLCTDLISEFYGRKRANFLVWVGLGLNLWVVFILWLGGALPMVPQMVTVPGADGLQLPPVPQVMTDAQGQFVRVADDWTYYRIQALAFGAVTASMIAYLIAQFIDVYLFHFWKRLTKGKHLWLRNNGSTVVSQFVDTFAVIVITHFVAHALPVQADKPIWPQLWLFIATGYVFKFAAALLDTPLVYLAVRFLGPYLRINPTTEHVADVEETQLPGG